MIPQDRFEGIGRLLVHRHGDVRVPIKGHRDRRMAQEIGDDLRMDPFTQ